MALDKIEKKYHNVASLVKLMDEMSERMKKIEEIVYRKSKPIHRVEIANGEEPSEPREERGLKMALEDKIQSMKNACAILPPNMIVNGRHEIMNVEAICGFKIDEYMMDAAYEE